MASEGPNDAGSGAGTSWTDPGNITALDGVVATFDVAASDVSTDLISSTFSFSLPAGSAVDGIEVSVRRSASGDPNVLRDYAVQLTKDGSNPVGDNNADASYVDNTGFEVITYGGPTDLWGTTWAYTEINASTFGLFLSYQNEDAGSSQQAQVDSVRITVYYTEAVDGTGSVEFPASALDGSGAQTNSGTGAVEFAASSLAGTGTIDSTGTGDFTAPVSTLAGDGFAGFLGAGDVTAVSELSGSAEQTNYGTGSVSFGFSLDGSGYRELLSRVTVFSSIG